MRQTLTKLLRSFTAGRHNQRKSPYFVVEGLRCCREALSRRPQWLEALVVSDAVAESSGMPELIRLAESAGVVVDYCSAGEFAQFALTEGPQGVLCVMRKPLDASPTRLDALCTVILDRVQEPGNFGTILRTAWALGLSQVWVTSGSADVWSPKVVRSGMGAQFALDVHYFPQLSDATDAFRCLGGTRVWCAVMNAATTCFSPSFAACGAALVLGNEGNGISAPELGEGVTIPMPGHAESLNVAQAATVLMFEALRQHGSA